MLAGERFSDHPRSVCPVIAGFLRTYNDLVAEGEHRHLYPLAALVVGRTSTWSVRRRRAKRLAEWAGLCEPGGPSSLRARSAPRHQIVVAAARVAARIEPPQRRRAAVAKLLDELVAGGHGTEAATFALSPPSTRGAPAAPAPPRAPVAPSSAGRA